MRPLTPLGFPYSKNKEFLDDDDDDDDDHCMKQTKDCSIPSLPHFLNPHHYQIQVSWK